MIETGVEILTEKAIQLLQQLIAIPSVSTEEDGTAQLLQQFLQQHGIHCHRVKNNVYACIKYFDSGKPSLLLNSHHDTVPANKAYTLNPHLPLIDDGKMFGLGSTDAGASLVSLLAAFMHFYDQRQLPFNLVFAASAEEEISGPDGIELLFADDSFRNFFRHPNSFAIVGEPTELNLAIAEKGLMVLDCNATGIAAHAAGNEGENALYKAIDAIEWFRNYRFQKVSPLLGEVKMSVTSIHTANKAHNIIPAHCSFVVDVRVTEMYTHEDLLAIIARHVNVEVIPRSTRLRSSSIAIDHPVVVAGIALGKTTYGSPTTSDKALIPLPSLKCGPGFSGQSHSANEFVALSAIEDAVAFYLRLLQDTFTIGSVAMQH